MADFGAYLLSISVPIAQRVLTGLGFGVVTYVGYEAAVTAARDAVIAYWGGIAPAPLAIISMVGVGEAVGIVLAAVATRAAMVQLKHLQIIK